jgi:beta-carotene 15,15'-dioxygenase
MRPRMASLAWHWPMSRTARDAMASGLIVLVASLAERAQPHVALLALWLVVGGLGTLHGVLDTVLVVRMMRKGWMSAGVLLAYLVVTLSTAWLLRPFPAVALMVLLLLSAWHFGESFDKPAPASTFTRLTLRLLRGGAPVLMPALVSQSALAPLAQAVAGDDLAAITMLWGFWIGLAWLWAATCAVWLLRSVTASAEGWRGDLLLLRELGGLALLNIVCSPLMAFALYFGLFHATGHIRRVWAHLPVSQRGQLTTDWRVWLTLLMSVALLAGLVWTMRAGAATVAWPDASLRLLIVGLVAVSVPHVVLISCWARLLRADRHQGQHLTMQSP